MKLVFTTLLLFFFSTLFAQENKSADKQIGSINQLLLVEASCGTCKFGLKGKTCALAVRINNKSYFVDGVNIDSFGDAHGEDGFCNAIRKAKVQGRIVNDRFVATSFVVLPAASAADKQ